MKPTPSQRVFITGGLGYVGGRCSVALAVAGHHLKIGSRRAATLQRPSWLRDGELCFYSTDQTVAELEKSFKDIDTIIHLASPNEHVAANFPEQTLVELGVGTLRLCQAAKAASVKRLIFFSTAHVYASPLVGSFHEMSVPLPGSPYAYAHLAAEHVIRSFAGSKGIPQCVIVRLTNSFGAPERLDVDRWTLLVNDLCKQAIRDKKLVLQSDGCGLRDFICLSDVTRGVEHLLAYSDLETPCEIFNLGLGHAVSVYEMAQIVAEEAGKFLNTEIQIHRPSAPQGAPTPAGLQIEVDKLKLSGFTWMNDIRSEIQATLKLCSTSD